MEILITTSHDGGWSSANIENRQVRRYMLTYKPIIDALKKRDKINARSCASSKT